MQYTSDGKWKYLTLSKNEKEELALSLGKFMIRANNSDSQAEGWALFEDSEKKPRGEHGFEHHFAFIERIFNKLGNSSEGFSIKKEKGNPEKLMGLFANYQHIQDLIKKYDLFSERKFADNMLTKHGEEIVCGIGGDNLIVKRPDSKSNLILTPIKDIENQYNAVTDAITKDVKKIIDKTNPTGKMFENIEELDKAFAAQVKAFYNEKPSRSRAKVGEVK